MRKITFFLSLLLIFIGGVTANAQTAAEPTAGKYYYIKVGGSKWIQNAALNNYPEGFSLAASTDSRALFKVEAADATASTYRLLYIGNGRATGYVRYSGLNARGTVVLGGTSTSENNNTWKFSQKNATDNTWAVFAGTDENNALNDWAGEGNLSLWSNKSDATGCTFVEVDVTDLLTEVTYKYVIGEDQYTEETVTQVKNSASVAPKQRYVRNDSYDPVTVTGNSQNVLVACSQVDSELPFTVSESYDKAVWYVMDIHNKDAGAADVSNGEKAYIWEYDNGSKEIKTPKISTDFQSLEDKQLWCFVGNVAAGFKIYNKAAGDSMTIRKAENGNTVSVMSVVDDRNAFKLYSSTAGAGYSDAYCFKLDGDTYYLNKQNLKLQGWSATDGGSSCRFFSPAHFPLNNNWEEVPVGVVGSYTYWVDEANREAYAKMRNDAAADEFDVEKAKEMAQMNHTVAQSPVVGIVSGGYYRIVCAFSGFEQNQGVKKAFLYNGNKISWGTLADNDVNAVFQIQENGDKYSIKSCNADQFMSGVIGKLGTDGAEVEFQPQGKAQYNVHFAGGNAHAEGHSNGSGSSGSLIAWGSGADGASAWYIVPATELNVALNAVDGEGSLATLHLPFNAMVKEGGTTVNVGALNDDKSKLMLSPVSGVPANTGVVLHNADAAASVTLTIGGDVEAAASALSGTNVSIALTDENRADYLIFSLVNGELGFYGISDALTQLAANKAYLPAAGLNPSGVRLMLGGDPTGIGNAVVTGLEDKAPLYDLSGRRVKEAAKGGIYLRNGKKFIVK